MREMREAANIRRCVSDMGSGSRLERLAALSIALVGALSLAAYGQSSPSSGTTSTSDSVLPRNSVVPLSVVDEFFPQVTQEASTGPKLDRRRQSQSHKERDLRDRRQLEESDDYR